MQRHYPLNPATGLEDAALLPWANGNPALGTEGSYPPFGLFTDPQDEILNAIAGSGQAIGSTLSQLLQALSRGIFLGTFAGTANALTATLPGAVTIPALTAGMRFSGIVASANTGSTTLTLAGFTAAPGAKAITRVDASATLANDLVVGQLITVVYDGTQFQAQHLSPAFVNSVLDARNVFGGNQTIYPTAGTYTWTPSAGTTRFKARVWAAGGGGGGAVATTASGVGGGGGEYREGVFPCVPGVGITIIVGAAGTAGAATPTAGGNGGTSSVGALISAIGGTGGGPSGGGVGTTGGNGGTGGSGGIGIPGRAAGTGYGSPLAGGTGGSAFGSSNPGPSVSSAGIPGVFPGGGANGSSANAAGGLGGSGLIIIEY